jgi:hypothetical protein
MRTSTCSWTLVAGSGWVVGFNVSWGRRCRSGDHLIHAPTGAVLVQFRWLALEGKHGQVDGFRAAGVRLEVAADPAQRRTVRRALRPVRVRSAQLTVVTLVHAGPYPAALWAETRSS